MRMTGFKKLLSALLVSVLIAAMALLVTGCGENSKDVSSMISSEQTSSVASVEEQVSVLGEGDTSFTFKVVDAQGKETVYQISTDKKTVGEALLELKLIAGEQGDYGLYVKTVKGITLDYDTDGKYWAFYEGDTYAQTGVDSTAVKDGATYSFKAE